MKEQVNQQELGSEGMPLGLVVWWLLVGGLALYGVFFVYSTCYVGDDYPVKATWTRHIWWLGLGVVASLVSSRLSPTGLGMRYCTWLGYGGSILGLLLVLCFGQSIGGARRWLSFGPVMLQPAEFAKVFTMLAVSQVLVRLRGWRRLLALCAVVLAPFGLIVCEPSVGNAFSLLPGVIAIVGVHGMWRRWWGMLVCLVVLGILGSSAGVLWIRHRGGAEALEQERVAGIFRGYHFRRLSSYLTPHGAWNERQSMMTLGSGGMTGKGYLEGTMKGLGFLPRTVAPTDFIFSVVGEELGFLFGVLPVLGLYMGLLSLGLHWCGHAEDELSCLCGVGVLCLIFTHIMVNVGMTVRLVPIIGLPLPLLSYGGSFTLATLWGLGLVYGAGRRRHLTAVGYGTGGKGNDSEMCLKLLGLLKIRIIQRGQAVSKCRD